MASHKAPTQVTVVTEEKSAFSQFVENNWKVAAGFAVVLSVGILGYQYTQEQSRVGSMQLWDRLNESIGLDPTTGAIGGSVEDVRQAAAELSGSPAEPFALTTQVRLAVGEREYDAAGEALSGLRQTGFRPLVEDSYQLGASEVEGTVLDHLATRLAAQKEWESTNPGLFSNPPLPEGSPKVEFETEVGSFTIGLYQEAAPKHVENFLKHVESGFYVGTRFHRVIKGFMVQGGDPNTKDLDKKAEWGQGGPGFKLDPEKSGLNHFSGYLSAAKQPGESQSSGSQFFLTTGDAHWLDGQHVVYGVVLEGMDNVRLIEDGEIDPEDGQGSMPIEPVEVLATRILP